MCVGQFWYCCYRCGGFGRLGGDFAPGVGGVDGVFGLFFGGVTRLLVKSSVLPDFSCFFDFLVSSSLSSRALALACCAWRPIESSAP